MNPSTDCINFNFEANFDDKKLQHVSRKLRDSNRWTKIYYQNIYKEIRKYFKVIGKCVDQVYFIEKWSNRQGLKIALSQRFSYVNFSMSIFSLSVGVIDTQMHICIIYIIIYIIYIFTFLYEVHFHTLTVLSAFSFITCVMVQ